MLRQVGNLVLGEESKEYDPPPELAAFLEGGPRPVYIGFGSLVLDHPQRLTHRIFKALAATGQRAVIQRGWGKLGAIDGAH